VIGALTFLVLLEGYILTGGDVPSFPLVAVITVFVGVAAGAVGHFTTGRLIDRNG
jgi:hypothetical protein